MEVVSEDPKDSQRDYEQKLLDYAAAVGAATDNYIATLTTKELDRLVPIMGQEWPVADVLALLVVHASGHLGEIAALKGIQGVKGLPF